LNISHFAGRHWNHRQIDFIPFKNGRNVATVSGMAESSQSMAGTAQHFRFVVLEDKLKIVYRQPVIGKLLNVATLFVRPVVPEPSHSSCTAGLPPDCIGRRCVGNYETQ
jgi:hypothetical protein